MTQRRLRVLWVYHSAVVSAWRQNQVRALADEGIEVTVVSAGRWNEGGAMVDLEIEPGEDVTRARTVGQHPFLFAYDPLPLRRILKNRTFDVIDAHEEPASLALAEVFTLMGLARVRSPIVCYSAQNILKRYPWPFRGFERRALARVSAVRSCNDDVSRVLRAKGFKGNVVNLGLGVDVDHFVPAERPRSADAQPFHVGYVGRFTEQKGVFTLLTALSLVDDVEATFVGAGPEESRLKAAIAHRGLGARVRVEGFSAHEELPRVYRRFDAVAAPSIDQRSWTEQFGRVATEAMACGIPMIVSDGGALAEVVADRGVVVPQQDARALAQAIARLRDHPMERDLLRAQGISRAREFSWSQVARGQAMIYRRVAAPDRGPE